MRAVPGWKSLLKFLVKAGVTAIAFWWISGKISWPDTLDRLRNTQIGWLFPALLLFNASKIVSAFRLELFWDVVGVRLSRNKNLALYYLGMFYNLFLPGGIGGDAYKVWLLNKNSGVKATKLVQAVVIDRITGLVPLIILACGIYVLTAISSGFSGWIKLGIFLLGLLAYVLSYYTIAGLFATFRDIFHRAALQGAGVQLLQAMSAICIILALGVKENVLTYLFLFLVSSIVAVLPLTLGGAGAREWAMVVGCQWFSLDKESGVALGLIFFLITALSSLPGGLLPSSWYQKQKEST